MTTVHLQAEDSDADLALSEFLEKSKYRYQANPHVAKFMLYDYTANPSRERSYVVELDTRFPSLKPVSIALLLAGVALTWWWLTIPGIALLLLSQLNSRTVIERLILSRIDEDVIALDPSDGVIDLINSENRVEVIQ